MMYWGVLLLVVGALAYDPQMYKGYRVVHFTPKTKAQVETVLKFGDNKEVLVMKEPRIGRQADYMVSPAQFGPLKAMLYQNGMTFTLNNRDVAGDLQVEWDSMLARGYPEMAYDIDAFNERADIEAELDRLAGTCAAQNLTCSTEYLPGPALSEGNRIKVFHMSAGGNPANSILWESMVHAREWLAGASLMRILDKMIKLYHNDTDVQTMINVNDFHFIPMMNPDGYQFSWDNDRYWRKNRRTNTGSACLGVDINRNFDANWSEPGASGSECSETYYGPSAASESETQTTVDFVNSITQPPWIMDISVHTYGYYMLAPYGNGTYPPNWLPDDNGFEGFEKITDDTCVQIEQTYDTTWDCGNSMDVLYETSGGSTDWMMQVAGMSYSYVPELRGNDFVVNPSQIPFSTEELWNGLKYLVLTTTNAASPKK